MNRTTRQVVERQITGLQNVLDYIEPPEYKSLCITLSDTLRNKGRIYISGVGKNANIATKISESMASLGVRSGYISPTNYLHGDAGFIESLDVVIHISRSGKTDEMHAMANHLYATRPHIQQFLIHCNENLVDTFFDHFTDTHYIPNVKEGDHLETAPNTSTTVFLCFLDSITAHLSETLGFTKENFLAYHPGGNLGNSLKQELNV